MSNIMDAIDSLDYVLDDIENIEAPDRHKEDQKKMNEGVSEARKGLDLIVDAFKLYEKGDSDSIEKEKRKHKRVRKSYSMQIKCGDLLYSLYMPLLLTLMNKLYVISHIRFII